MLSQHLNQKELDLAYSIFEKGLTNACRSFSTLAKQNIEFKMSDLGLFKSNSNETYKINKKGRLVLLTTEIIGEMHGLSYLVFDENEINEIYDSCLPKGLPQDQQEEVGNAILKELDNILSAAVITEISNRLNVKIFGEVPHCQNTDPNTIESDIKNRINLISDYKSNFYLTVDAKFIFENQHSFSPIFIWKLNDKIISLLKGNNEMNKIST